MRPSRAALTLPVNGEPVPVHGIPHLRCPACGEKVLTFDQAGMLERNAQARYRSKYHLLDPDGIRALRERLDLTQAALADLLRLGANTISRWEAGRNVQTGAMDVLLRLIRDVPECRGYLVRQPGAGSR
jgi:putative zinc finger/helix-turn-helix YgiT family protein